MARCFTFTSAHFPSSSTLSIAKGARNGPARRRASTSLLPRGRRPDASGTRDPPSALECGQRLAASTSILVADGAVRTASPVAGVRTWAASGGTAGDTGHMTMEPSVTAVGELVTLLDHILEEHGFGRDHWHSLIWNLSTIEPVQWTALPPGGGRTIREIVLHVGSGFLMYESHAFGDGTRLHGDRIVNGVGPGETPEETTAWLRLAHATLRERVAGLTDDQLGKPEDPMGRDVRDAPDPGVDDPAPALSRRRDQPYPGPAPGQRRLGSRRHGSHRKPLTRLTSRATGLRVIPSPVTARSAVLPFPAGWAVVTSVFSPSRPVSRNQLRR